MLNASISQRASRVFTAVNKAKFACLYEEIHDAYK
jgi:hypothetical protein